MSNNPMVTNSTTPSPEQVLAHVQQAVDDAVHSVEKSVSQAKEMVGDSFNSACDRASMAKTQIGASMAQLTSQISSSSKQGLSNTVDKTRSVRRSVRVAFKRWLTPLLMKCRFRSQKIRLI